MYFDFKDISATIIAISSKNKAFQPVKTKEIGLTDGQKRRKVR